MREQIEAVIYNHKALNNQFYDLWLARRFTLAEFLIFVREYFAWVQSFPDTLLLLAFHSTSLKDKMEYLSTIWSESGRGRQEKVHWGLAADTFSQIVSRLGGSWEPDKDVVLTDYSALLSTTRDLITGQRRLYTHAQRAVAAGAQVALELSAFRMLWLINRGLELHYSSLWDDPMTFCRDVQEYTLVHIASAEKDHEEEALRAGERYLNSQELTALFSEGMKQHLQLIAGFWEGIHKTITQK